MYGNTSCDLSHNLVLKSVFIYMPGCVIFMVVLVVIHHII